MTDDKREKDKRPEINLFYDGIFAEITTTEPLVLRCKNCFDDLCPKEKSKEQIEYCHKKKEVPGDD